MQLIQANIHKNATPKETIDILKRAGVRQRMVAIDDEIRFIYKNHAAPFLVDIEQDMKLMAFVTPKGAVSHIVGVLDDDGIEDDPIIEDK